MNGKHTITSDPEIVTINDQVTLIVRSIIEITNAIKIISDNSPDEHISSALQECALSANRHLHTIIHGQNIDNVVQDAIFKFIPDPPPKNSIDEK